LDIFIGTGSGLQTVSGSVKDEADEWLCFDTVDVWLLKVLLQLSSKTGCWRIRSSSY